MRDLSDRVWATGALTALALAIALEVVLPAAALAHVPAIEGTMGLETGDAGHGEATPMGGPEKSRAVYGYLGQGAVDSYTFTTSEVVTRRIGVIVPDYPEHEGFRPSIVLEEDGIEVAEDAAAVDGGWEPEFEPFSLTTFLQGSEVEWEFEPGAQYVVRIEPGHGDVEHGRYVLVVSGPEEFTAADIRGTLRQLPRIWFGAYGGAPARWNTLALIPILFVAVAASFAVWAFVRIIRSRGLRGSKY